MLAARAATVRWGVEAGEELLVRTDDDLAAAGTAFAQLSDLLAAPAALR